VNVKEFYLLLYSIVLMDPSHIKPSIYKYTNSSYSRMMMFCFAITLFCITFPDRLVTQTGSCLL